MVGPVVRLGVLVRMRRAAVGVSWRRSEQGVLRQRQLDGQALALATVDVDGVELAAADPVQDGLFGHAESAGSLLEPNPSVGCVRGDLGAELGVDADPPRVARAVLLAVDEAAGQPPVESGAGGAQQRLGFGDANHVYIVADGYDRLGRPGD